MTPVLSIGLDVGYRRDSSAVAAVYRDGGGSICLRAHRIWEPPVRIPDVTEYVENLFANEQVSGLWFDPHQFASEAQRLSEAGYGRYLNEVNQSGPFMIEIATNLHILIQRGMLGVYPDSTCRQHIAQCGIKATEQGPRIIKTAQTKQIDFVVAYAMAVYGCSQDGGHVAQAAFDEDEHVVQLEMLV
jgi:phage terminase large subunit-like protein